MIANSLNKVLRSRMTTFRSIALKGCCHQKPSCPSQITKATIRQQAPSFSGVAFMNGYFGKIENAKYSGKWVVLFFYPLDNTFVCPTEIISLSDMNEKFQEIDTQVIACSIDSHFSHKEWANKPRDQGGLSPVKIPMLSDLSQSISLRYGVRINEPNDALHGVALRATFIIDPKGILRHSSVNDLQVGRNAEEILRLVKAFQHAEKYGENCQASWSEGKKAIAVGSADKVKEFFKAEYTKPKI